MISHPGLFLVLAAALIAPLRGWPRATLAIAGPLASLILVWNVPEGVHWKTEFLGMELAPYAVDKLSRLFALIFALMALGGALFALNQQRRAELPAALLYAGAAIGAALAGD